MGRRNKRNSWAFDHSNPGGSILPHVPRSFFVETLPKLARARSEVGKLHTEKRANEANQPVP